MDAYDALGSEGYRSDIKITSDETVSAHELNKILPSSSLRLLGYSLYLNSNISAETAAEDMLIFTIFHESS